MLFQNLVIINHPFDLQVRNKPSTQKECIDELVHLLQNRFRDQSGIIYTTSVKDCDQLASDLRQQKCRVASYHASLEPSDRTQVHTGWRDNKYQVQNCLLPLFKDKI